MEALNTIKFFVVLILGTSIFFTCVLWIMPELTMFGWCLVLLFIAIDLLLIVVLTLISIAEARRYE